MSKVVLPYFPLSYTVSDVQERTGLSARTLRRMYQDGELRTSQLRSNGRHYVARDELARLLRDLGHTVEITPEEAA